ncbi:hypothetical protein T265_06914 [Opisthorchis viverrini]|uniref:Uncharacterized protein n=1 Tax=Opisthorchis viverrini TaxID=6198 RepID=A0A074ZET1_OPIVI|nr:hypothetical protein T265_06914 [Opisthorchis viverrini]KER25678.1 hypothetical protein T265_06914 [Opisthorchis viverrini]
MLRGPTFFRRSYTLHLIPSSKQYKALFMGVITLASLPPSTDNLKSGVAPFLHLSGERQLNDTNKIDPENSARTRIASLRAITRKGKQGTFCGFSHPSLPVCRKADFGEAVSVPNNQPYIRGSPSSGLKAGPRMSQRRVLKNASALFEFS